MFVLLKKILDEKICLQLFLRTQLQVVQVPGGAG
jgi:hypothetical protein